MTAKYKLVKNPRASLETDSEIIPLHPRLISNGTINSEELIETAKERSSFSSADMKGVLQLIKDTMTDFLMAGYNVELSGIGVFSVSLGGPTVTNQEKIRAESIHFKNVNFRASKEMKEKLKTMTVMREKNMGNNLFVPSFEECKENLFKYLESSSFITMKDYMSICKCSRSKASLDLRKFVSEKLIQRKRFGTMYLYYKEKGDESKMNFQK